MDNHFLYQQNPRRSQKYESLSFFLGILSVTGICLGYPALIGGSLAIVFALLSRGGTMSMTPRATFSMILGIISLTLVILIITGTILLLISYYGGLRNIPLDYEQILNDMETMRNSYMNQLLAPTV